MKNIRESQKRRHRKSSAFPLSGRQPQALPSPTGTILSLLPRFVHWLEKLW